MFIKKFFKIFGIVIASLAVVAGGTVGVLGLTGKLSPEFVALNSIVFSQPDYYIDSDTSITINPYPENSTQLDLVLKAENKGVVDFNSSVKAGESFVISPIKTNGVNNGGFTKLTAYYGKTIYCEAMVYVDVPVQNIEIKTSSNNTYNTLISGTNTTLTLNYSGKSIKPYGDEYNYENISKEYREFNEETNTFEIATYSIQEGGEQYATVDAETGVLTALNTGTFTVEAKSFKTYQDRIDYETHKLNGDFKVTSWGSGKVDGKEEDEYLNDLLVLTTRTFTIRDVILNAISVTQPNSDIEVKDIYLYETVNLTYDEIGLKLTPEAISGFNSDDMKYRLQDVKLEAVNKQTKKSYTDEFSITDLTNESGEKIGWKIQCLDYQAVRTNKTELKFSISSDGVEFENEENIISATLPINLKTNQITNFTFKNIDGTYTKNLNFFAYSNEIISDGLNLNDLVSISFENNDKPALYTSSSFGYTKVKFFIKDYNEEDYEDRVVDCVKATGEIRNGIINIINAGSVEIEAKAIHVKQNGEAYLKNEDNPTSYHTWATANLKSDYGECEALNLLIKERLTNLKLEFDDEDSVIFIDCKQGDEDLTAVREQQTIKLKLSCTSSKEDEKYCNKLIGEMIQNNQLIKEKTNTTLIGESADITYSYDPINCEISAYLRIPKVESIYFNTKIYSDVSEYIQLIIRNVQFEIKLSDEVAIEYGKEASKFSSGKLTFNVTTSRASNLIVTSNKDEEELTYINDNDEQVTSNMFNHNGIDGYVMVYNKTNTWGTLDNKNDFTFYANIAPTDAIDSRVFVESSNADLIETVNYDNTVNIDISNDEELTNSLGEDSTAQVIYNRIKYNTISYKNAISDIKNNSKITYVNINGTDYIYYTNVKLSFIAYDDTFKVENQQHGVMQEVYVHILLAVRDVILTKIEVTQPENDEDIIELHLNETIELTYEDVGLKLTPEEGSELNSDDMKYRFSTVKLKAINKLSQESYNDEFVIATLKDDKGRNIGWTIKCIDEQVVISNNVELKFSVSVDGSDSDNEEDYISTTLPINLMLN